MIYAGFAVIIMFEALLELSILGGQYYSVALLER
jgi:hypothetical protein